jgi:hypothetical protein
LNFSIVTGRIAANVAKLLAAPKSSTTPLLLAHHIIRSFVEDGS